MKSSTSAEMRAFNERLILGAIRRRGPLSKADLARETGLSNQAAAVIVNTLIADGLLRKEAKVRGRIGQPYTPISLDPDGAFAFGAKIGRRSVEAVIVNLSGALVDERRSYYDAPMPDVAMDALRRHIDALRSGMSERAASRVVGLGVAMPGEFHGWETELGLPEGALDGWRRADPVADLAARTGFAAMAVNDASAACAAELIAGDALNCRSALYVYVGAFIGGGLVIDGRLYRGDRGNAGALGSMPLGSSAQRPAPQLLHCASIIQLEHALKAAGLDAPTAIEQGAPVAEPYFDAWLADAAPAIAWAVVAAASVIDIEKCVIDGVMNPAWRIRLVEAVATEVTRFNLSGLSRLDIAEGGAGAKARVLGAALLPLEQRFSPDAESPAAPQSRERAVA